MEVYILAGRRGYTWTNEYDDVLAAKSGIPDQTLCQKKQYERRHQMALRWRRM